MRFVGEAAFNWRSVTGFTVVRCQVDVVRVILQTSCPLFSFFTLTAEFGFLGVGTVCCTVSTYDTKAFEFVADRATDAVAVGTLRNTSTFVFAQVLNGKVQAVNQTEEVGVTIGSNAAYTTNEEVIAVCRVTAKLRQHIGVTQCVVNHTVVTTVVDRTRISEFQTCECQTSFVTFLGISAFRVVTLEVIFPLTITGQIGIDLCFPFKTKTGISFVAVSAVTVYTIVFRKIMQTDSFTVQIYFVAIFVIDFCSVCSTCY